MGLDAEHGGVVTAELSTSSEQDEGGTQGVVGALVALALGVGVAALIDFAGIAGQGFRVGQYLLAVAPWLLLLRGRPLPGQPAHQGAVALTWVLLLAGALGQTGVFLSLGHLYIGAAVLQAAGAAMVLVLLYQAGHLSAVGLAFRMSAGVVAGAALAAVARQPVVELAIEAATDVLISLHLLPQLVHDVQVAFKARKDEEWEGARLALDGVSMSFILWTLAGHLIIAPAILYWSPKSQVFFGGFGAAIALGLFGVRGWAGAYSWRAAVGVISVAVVYGVGLAIAVTGGRAY